MLRTNEMNTNKTTMINNNKMPAPLASKTISTLVSKLFGCVIERHNKYMVAIIKMDGTMKRIEMRLDADAYKHICEDAHLDIEVPVMLYTKDTSISEVAYRNMRCRIVSSEASKYSRPLYIFLDNMVEVQNKDHSVDFGIRRVIFRNDILK